MYKCTIWYRHCTTNNSEFWHCSYNIWCVVGHVASRETCLSWDCSDRHVNLGGLYQSHDFLTPLPLSFPPSFNIYNTFKSGTKIWHKDTCIPKLLKADFEHWIITLSMLPLSFLSVSLIFSFLSFSAKFDRHKWWNMTLQISVYLTATCSYMQHYLVVM